MEKFYAGIGSRETPADIIEVMYALAAELAVQGYVLRSGGASGADTAFEQGCDSVRGDKRIYLPWATRNGRKIEPPQVQAGSEPEAYALAARHHPAWGNCSPGAQALHARNSHIVLGRDLQHPALFVLCWTQGASGRGGTGQGIRIAKARGIPVYDLGRFSKLVQEACKLRYVEDRRRAVRPWIPLFNIFH